MKYFYPPALLAHLVVLLADDFLAVDCVVRTLDGLPAVVAVDLCLLYVMDEIIGINSLLEL